MSKIFGLLIFLFSFLCSYSQKNEREVRLIDYIPKNCTGMPNVENLLTRIISKDFKGDTLYLHLGFNYDCCVEIDPIINYECGVLNLDIDKRGRKSGVVRICDCICCYELTLVIVGLLGVDFTTMIGSHEIPLTDRKYKTFPVTFQIENGDTINRTNKYGHRVGVWNYYKDSVLNFVEIYSDKGFLEPEMIGWKSCYPNGAIKTSYTNGELIWYDTNGNVTTIRNRHEKNTYYPSGKLKRSCKYWEENVNNKAVKRHRCNDWAEDGVLLINGERLDLKWR